LFGTKGTRITGPFLSNGVSNVDAISSPWGVCIAYTLPAPAIRAGFLDKATSHVNKVYFSNTPGPAGIAGFPVFKKSLIQLLTLILKRPKTS